MTNSSNHRLDSIDNSLRELVELARLEQQNFAALREVTQQQAQTAAAQSENIRSLAAAVGELARATTELSRDRRSLMETAQRAAQASETAAFVAQRTLEAVRDLIDELRSNRT